MNASAVRVPGTRLRPCTTPLGVALRMCLPLTGPPRRSTDASIDRNIEVYPCLDVPIQIQWVLQPVSGGVFRFCFTTF